VEHLTQIMRRIVHNRAEAKRKGEIAARVIPKMCSWKTVLDRLFYQLPAWVGSDVWTRRPRNEVAREEILATLERFGAAEMIGEPSGV
jgi:hypothetical protein